MNHRHHPNPNFKAAFVTCSPNNDYNALYISFIINLGSWPYPIFYFNKLLFYQFKDFNRNTNSKRKSN